MIQFAAHLRSRTFEKGGNDISNNNDSICIKKIDKVPNFCALQAKCHRIRTYALYLTTAFDCLIFGHINFFGKKCSIKL